MSSGPGSKNTCMPSHILIADDDAMVLQSIAWVLREQGYDVATVSGGTELMTALNSKTPDLLLLDIVMPDADGYELLARIKGDVRWRDMLC